MRVTSKPANGSGLGLGCFTPPPPEEASLFSCANSVDASEYVTVMEETIEHSGNGGAVRKSVKQVERF
jgi:hypothetical protein